MNKVFKYILPDLSLSENIAIVGSSDTILNGEYGDLIDDFDDVIRFNRSEVNSYEKYVGLKTTVRVCNWHVFGNIILPDTQHQSNNKNFIKTQNNCNILLMDKNINEVYRKNNIHKSSKMYSVVNNQNNHFRKIIVGTHIKKTYGLNITHASVGLSTVILCVLNNIKPNLFGFGLTEKDKTSHYWEQRDKNPKHHFLDERKVLRELLKEDKIIIHL